MKHILLVITFLSLMSAQGIKKSAPTILEKAVFKQLNLYRKQHGLNPIAYDSIVTTVARYHANYLGIAANAGHLCHNDKGPHDEQFDVPNFTEMNFEKRTTMAPEKNIYSEIQIQKIPLLPNQTPEEFAARTISCFASSPPHNEAMLQSEFKGVIFYMGVAVVQHPKTDLDSEPFYSVNIDFGYQEIKK